MILVRTTMLRNVNDVGVKRRAEIGSYHFLAEMRMKTDLKRDSKCEIICEEFSSHSYKLQNEETRLKYQEECDLKFAPRQDGSVEEGVENVWRH
ncbi:hypothetical protein ILUMI_21429 [Ignelater luminosus]|uniref:Uncharacterized protein n=1 Tax=Ignelater luminosus TaxID=2038154 RepID=A0A8K0CCH3_IGNLU|nr:hypothetical protein ILUMI_21429 [Ignelater luminosus]